MSKSRASPTMERAVRMYSVFPDWAVSGLVVALDYGGSPDSIRDLQEELTFGEIECWGNDEETACLVTRVVRPFGVAALETHIILATGEMDAVLDLADDVEKVARARGHRSLTLIGRKGWGRVLPSRGWEAGPLVFMTKMLEDPDG